jgi:hypothetical protein
MELVYTNVEARSETFLRHAGLITSCEVAGGKVLFNLQPEQ